MPEPRGEPDDDEAVRSLLTATSRNALSRAELDDFLAGPRIGRLGTVGRDGAAHVTPVWFLWEDGTLAFSLSETRVHVANLRRDPRATVCVDEDDRPGVGLTGDARGAMLHGGVTLRGPVPLGSDMDGLVAPTVLKVAVKYLGAGADDLSRYPPAMLDEPRVLCVVTPSRIVSWDFAKAA
jgi:PPOX class probable F420-dependent enzyme